MRVIVEPSYAEKTYAECLNFEDNQFKKQNVDVHDQTISGIHASKQKEEEKDEFEK
jgi:hypothetical protein